MTKEQIIVMARQTGFRVGPSRDGPDDVWGVVADLERFAKLIAEKEREVCIAHAMTSAEKAIDVAIKLEREACAKIVEESSLPDTYSEPCLLDIANEIRARGDEA